MEAVSNYFLHYTQIKGFVCRTERNYALQYCKGELEMLLIGDDVTYQELLDNAKWHSLEVGDDGKDIGQIIAANTSTDGVIKYIEDGRIAVNYAQAIESWAIVNKGFYTCYGYPVYQYKKGDLEMTDKQIAAEQMQIQKDLEQMRSAAIAVDMAEERMPATIEEVEEAAYRPLSAKEEAEIAAATKKYVEESKDAVKRKAVMIERLKKHKIECVGVVVNIPAKMEVGISLWGTIEGMINHQGYKRWQRV
jgi:hypothetical protein